MTFDAPPGPRAIEGVREAGVGVERSEEAGPSAPRGQLPPSPRRWSGRTRLVLEQIPSLRVVIIGDTTDEPTLYRDLLERRRALDLDDIVAFAGFRDDVVRALNALDIFVMSSMKEGLPLAVLQAMAVHLPIAATRCGGPDEILSHGANAWLVPVPEPQALADGILRLARSPEERLRLRRAASANARPRTSVRRNPRTVTPMLL
jgi:glycosyltransferase involved in cell wall biosynthesis